MSKPITLSHKQWNLLKNRLTRDYRPSTILIKSKMRATLGFTDREYIYWTSKDSPKGKSRPITDIRLDFYDEAKRTFFLLKYGEYLNDNTNKG